MNNLSKIFFLFWVSSFVACNNTSDCPNGAPVAMFKANNPNIVQHSFEVKDQNSTETVRYNMGTELQIWQGGCQNIKQEFQFKIFRSGQGETNVFDLAVQQLVFLAKSQENLASFAEWARVIENNKLVFEPGVLNIYENAVGIKVDMVEGPDFTTLLIEFSQINSK